MIEDDFVKWAAPYINALDVANMVKNPIHFITPDGIIRYVNQAWVEKYKVSREDAVNHHITSLDDLMRTMEFYLSLEKVTPDLAENITDLSFSYMKTPLRTPACIQAVQERREISVVSKMPDGAQVLVRSTPIFDEKGEIVLVFTQVQDLSLIAGWRDRLDQEITANLRMQEELQLLRENQAKSKLLGNSRQMMELRNLISMISKSDASVLISGESGVGKEVVAKEIYRQSLRCKAPFLTLNCATIPENLIESELFGYEKGAFTGAYKTKLGLFEVADGGTIMLDEIGELPIHLQPKLLRVLQEQEILRVGGSKNIPINVRVIAATNRDLPEQIRSGKFRSDLYYRLNVVPIQIPPLRDRREDIALLASRFLETFNQKYNTSKFFLSQSMMLLEQHNWPGNVRELENVVERLVIVCSKGAITPQQVLMVFSGRLNTLSESDTTPVLSLKDAVEQLEKRMISEALSNYKSTYKAARALGMSQSTLARKVRELKIQREKAPCLGSSKTAQLPLP